MTNDQQAAKNFSDECARLGWDYSIKGLSTVCIHKKFTPGDKKAYSNCDSEAYSLLSMVPLKGGSIWGTDGGSIGGMVGMNGGYYTLNKSGNGSKRFLVALGKI